MAKVFTITAGLENMGAMKSGGQGSVYKGRRIGEIITAVKLLPTPIYSESSDDKNFISFQNEVEKLKKVNEKPNPNVVKILSSGLSETGNFPFIEMEYIEGPDLEELLQTPDSPVFSLKEVIKVAEQLSNALAHCHSLGVRHGDIKSNNVKFNIHTGNYVLLDFGLAIMSDEQRRTSLRNAGAVEFMAPEQNEGQMLFQTDVYSFGVVLFEVLTGRVPFPLYNKGETARNNVRLAHIETLPPDIVSLRKDTLPAAWPDGKREREIDIPGWLVRAIYKCLNKKPEDRFGDGVQLHNFITQTSVHVLPAVDTVQQTALLEQEKQQLHKQLSQYRDQLREKESEHEELQTKAHNENAAAQLYTLKNNAGTNNKNRIAKSSFIAVLFIAVALAAFSGYSYFKNTKQEKQVITSVKKDKVSVHNNPPVTKKIVARKKSPAITKKAAADTGNSYKKIKKSIKKVASQPVPASADVAVNDPVTEDANKIPHQYTVISKAFFYTAPDESSRRPAFINHWNNAVLTPQDEMNGFIYIVYTNDRGQTSRGWLRKKDLKLVN